MQATTAYNACMKKHNPKTSQYTLRNVPERTDAVLREKAAEYGASLNETALRILNRGLGLEGAQRHADFDAYAGSWVEDEACDRVIQDFQTVDEEMWS